MKLSTRFTSLPASLSGLSGKFPGNACWSWGLGRVVGGEGLPVPVEMGAERKRRPQQVVCYRDETGGLGLEERKTREWSRNLEAIICRDFLFLSNKHLKESF